MPSLAEILYGIVDPLRINHLISTFLPSYGAAKTAAGPAPRHRVNHNNLPIHAKNVFGAVVIEKLHALTSVSASLVVELKYQLGWLSDDSRYVNVPLCSADNLPQARLTAKDVVDLLKVKLIREIHPSKVRGAVKMFTVAELTKARKRPIRHTADSNAVFPRKDPLHPVTMATKNDIIKLVHAGAYMASHDLAGWFDQLAYSDDVGSRFCFRSGNKCYAITCLAMGQRQSVGVASAVTRRLLDFKHRSAKCLIVIDNIIFVGSKEDVIADSIEFRRRCADAGAILNDLDVPVEQLAVQRGDWCGVSLDLINKTVALQQKAVGKTLLSWSLHTEWTWRTFHSCIGSLFWSMGILDVPVHQKFRLMRFISRVGADLSAHPELWDAPAHVWPCALEDIKSWVDLIERNKPRHVPLDEEPQWLIATDASRFGWGYVAINTASHQIRSHGVPWSPYLEQKYGENLGHSTTAEPIGLVNSVCHLFAPHKGVRKVRIATDNTATKFSFNRGFSTHSLIINQSIGRLRSLFPDTDFDIVHVAGIHNWADGPSRGRPLSPDEEQEAAHDMLQSMG